MLRRPGANHRIAACTSPVYLHDTIDDKLFAIDLGISLVAFWMQPAGWGATNRCVRACIAHDLPLRSYRNQYSHVIE